MTILEQIDADFKGAMRSKDELALSVLRLIKTSLKNKQIDLGHAPDHAETEQVLRAMIKQYQDALSDFSSAGRQDLVERQQKEIDLIAKYLPPPLSSDELRKIVYQALEASDIKEVGKAMGVAMKAVSGRADAKDVRPLVESYFHP
jgi:uncharacterized protein YqeY